MFKEYFADNPLAPLGIVAMGMFMALFLLAAWRAWRRPARDLAALAALPLQEPSSPSSDLRGALRGGMS